MGHSNGFSSEWDNLWRFRWYTSRKALPHNSQPWFFLTGFGGFFTTLWCCMLPIEEGVMMLVPEDTEVVAVDRIPAAVEMYDGLPLFSRGMAEIIGTIVGAVWGSFFGRDTILMPV